MRLLALRRFIPNQPWRLSSWRGMRPYLEFRLSTMGRRPTIRETWDYLGWCRDTARFAKRQTAESREEAP